MSETPDTIPIEELLEHRRWLVALARRIVGASRADDLVQETYLVAMERPPRARRGLRGWLATVLRNRARQDSRHDRAEGRAVERRGAPPAATGDDVVAAVERGRELARAVLGLDEPYRTTVLLRYYRGLSAAAIARRTGVPAGTVRSRLKRGLDRLRDDLESRHGGRRSLVLFLLPLANRTGWKGALAVSTTTKIAVTLALALAAGTVAFSQLSAAPSPAAPPPARAAAADSDPVAAAPAPAPADEAPEGPAPAPGKKPVEGAKDSYAARLERTIDLNLTDTEFRVVMELLASRSGLAWRFAADPNRSDDELLVNLQAEGITIRNALDLLTLTKGLAWKLRDGVIEIRPQERKVSRRLAPVEPVDPGPAPETFEVHPPVADLAVPLSTLPANRAVLSVTKEGWRSLRAPGGGRARTFATGLAFWLALHDLADAAGREDGPDSPSRLDLLVEADADASVTSVLSGLRFRGIRVRRLWIAATRPDGTPGALPALPPDAGVGAPVPGESGPRVLPTQGGSEIVRDLYRWCFLLDAAREDRREPLVVDLGWGGTYGQLVGLLNESVRFGFVVRAGYRLPFFGRPLHDEGAGSLSLVPRPGSLSAADVPELVPGRSLAGGGSGGLVLPDGYQPALDLSMSGRKQHRNLRAEGGGAETMRALDAALARLRGGKRGSVEETGIAALALLAAGEIPEADLAWLASRAADAGPNTARALIEAYGLTKEARWYAPARRIADRLMKEWVPGDPDRALRIAAALLAGGAPELLPPRVFRERVSAWLDRETDPATGRFAGDGETPRRTAIAAWVRFWLGEDPEVGVLARSLDVCDRAFPGPQPDSEFRHYAALALFQAGHGRWRRETVAAIVRALKAPMSDVAGGEADARRALLASIFFRFTRLTH